VLNLSGLQTLDPLSNKHGQVILDLQQDLHSNKHGLLPLNPGNKADLRTITADQPILPQGAQVEVATEVLGEVELLRKDRVEDKTKILLVLLKF
jgi:hypothetical protein